MFHPDTDAGRQFAREHQAELKQDWQRVNPAKRDVVESRRHHRRLRLYWLRTHLRPANHTS